jgi:hypothetical protein
MAGSTWRATIEDQGRSSLADVRLGLGVALRRLPLDLRSLPKSSSMTCRSLWSIPDSPPIST